MYLLRTYRKIINEFIQKEEYSDAYLSFQDFFQKCKNNVTATDRRKFNKLVDTLNDLTESNYSKIDVLEIPEIEIIASEENTSLINQKRIIKDEHFQIKNWIKLFFMNDHTLYWGKCAEKDFAQTYSKFYSRNLEGQINNKFTSNQVVYRFNYSENSDKFVTSSENLIFYLFSVKNGFINSFDLNKYSEHKYHLRCIDISSDGNLLLFTNIDNVYLMNSDFKIINSWKMPPKDGWKKRTTERSVKNEITDNLSKLGLTGNPSIGEIKNAFKQLAIANHPDQNPNDHNANEKMREIIVAYEQLTHESAENVFRESTEYYKTINQFKIRIPNTNMSINVEMGLLGSAEDWIYATSFGKSGNIYLGCYSGKLYCLSHDGKLKTIYNCYDVIRSIKEINDHLFIQTDDILYVLKDNKFLIHLKISVDQELQWLNGGFLIKNSNEISIFSDNGLQISVIRFKNRITDFYKTKNGLNVIASNKIYEFEVKIPDESLKIDNDRICNECGVKNHEKNKFCTNCGMKLN